MSWLKARIRYFIHNWIYTTNHKRIAINYFLFVILAGIVGLILATAIRLEFAYPGVGIFAGDSLQYLTVASAHGVIMVFFMIMPLLFGAFANFLLPTQLGVHDVAFPRLNSAAFWFLPGGLIMLAQMICVDRRYQRMNCFNVREIQALLKQRFFTNLDDDLLWSSRLPSSVSTLRFTHNGELTDAQPIWVTFTRSPRALMEMRPITLSTDPNTARDLGQYHTRFTQLQEFLTEHLILLVSYAVTVYGTLLRFIIEIIRLSFGSLQFLLSLILAITSIYMSFIALLTGAVFSPISFTNSQMGTKFYNLLISHFSPHFQLGAARDWTLPNWDTFKGILRYIYPYNEVMYFIDLWNSSQSPIVTSIKLQFSLIKTEREDYPRFLWLQIRQCTHQNYSITQFFHELFLMSVNVTFFLSRYTPALKRLNSFDDYLNYAAASYRPIDQQVMPYLAIVQDLFQVVRHTLLYLYRVNGRLQTDLYNASQSPHFFLLRGTVNFFEKPKLVNSLHPFTNASTVYSQYHTSFTSDVVTVFCSDAIYGSYSTLVSGGSLIFHPYHFSNFVDVYYSYVTGFYEIRNMRKFYQRVINDVDSIPAFQSPYNADPIHRWFKVALLKLFLALDALYTSSQKSQELAFQNFVILINVTCRELVQCARWFFARHPIWPAWTLPPLINPDFEKITSLGPVAYSYLRETIGVASVSHFTWFRLEISLYRRGVALMREWLPLYFQISEGGADALVVESSHSTRHLRDANPRFKYDYKTGDYFPKTSREQNLHLFPSILMLSSSSPFAAWHVSADFRELAYTSYVIFNETLQQTTSIVNPSRPLSYDHLPLFSFYYPFSVKLIDLGTSPFSTWATMNQQFYRLFLTSSMQQRVLSNWRQLKFTREAWRCKLLSARHQKTLYRRYLQEDGVFWSIERNARDLLPGWAMITPFSSRTRFTAVGKVDIGLMGVLLVLNSSIISAANFLVTYRYLSSLNNRKMRDARSFFAEGVMVASWMMIAANPMLVIGIIMLLSDRHWQTSFFDYSGGGDTILFQHMFWFFGHPEVYIIMIPVFGFTNTTLSYYLRKRVSARASLMYSMYTIAFLGFFVWGHHMYMVGLAHTTRMLFSTLTVMISVPAATKLMHWCVTIANSAFVVELPLLFTLTFIFLFVSGGISGMCVAHTGMDVLFHDTFYVIGHFHVMLAGAAMFGCFGAFYFYFSAIFGVKYSRLYSYLHYSYYLSGQLITVAPMFWLGYAGMPRRVLDYPASLGGWHSLISAGHLLSVAGIISFFVAIFDSLRQAKAALRTTLGINRYNTCLNFYLFELSRLKLVKQKFGYAFNFLFHFMIKQRRRPVSYFEEYELTIISYTFKKRESRGGRRR